MKKAGWKSKRKQLRLDRVTAHMTKDSSIIGRAPENDQISFTPAELFGAMAQCSSRAKMDQYAARAHVEACRHLVARHVDDTSDEFAVLESVKGLKDYFPKAMTGLVGDGIAYLQMIRDGYRWIDHFENYAYEKPEGTKRTPDFIFSRSDNNYVALTEAKATKGTSKAAFEKTVEDGYLGQVAPYLGEKIGGFVASHGFAVGSWMTSDKKAEVFVHHTGSPMHGDAEDGPREASDPSEIRFGNYCGVFTLLFGPEIGEAARARTWKPSRQGFGTIDWLGRTWIIGELLVAPPEIEADGHVSFRQLPFFPILSGVALELETAKRVFAYIEAAEPSASLFENLPEFDIRLRDAAKEAGGAIFPDGFAILGHADALENYQPNGLPPSQQALKVNEPLEVATVAAESIHSIRGSSLLAISDQHDEVETDALQQALTYLTNG